MAKRGALKFEGSWGEDRDCMRTKFGGSLSRDRDFRSPKLAKGEQF